ncbi:PAS domain S-box-containing protein [Halohasta litchfieldiae]|jgi:PAS domain S-box-containing protein|uniref:PAS domain S-box-containing protein n=1 Tax=Halohasta litchfieldiae TaxID=1073996 RepID=A0A1H6Y4X2_9EURY|nr:histidine kinase N-terminal 7TM domain-containing protein [Halohasta litchfieldiae]ATW86828.1 PAS domain S-box-containing protein [Halohasta litchfieldiae]SEJ36319.1 PAS domain S-box-containing protein [Halohasta litchfieldiae]
MYSMLPVFQLAVLSGLLSTVLAVVSYRVCETQSKLVQYSFVGVAISCALWAFGYSIYLIASPAESYNALRWLWLGLIPYSTLWFVFVVAYTDQKSLLTRPVLGLLAIEPVVMLGAALTMPAHRLFVSGETTGMVGSQLVVLPTLEPIFAFHQTYMFLLGVLSILFLIRTLGDTDPAYHPQLLVLVAAGAVPLLGPVQQLFNFELAAIHGPPLVLSLFSTLILLGSARYRLFDILPTAHGRVLSTMEDGVVLVDDEGRIRIANTAARRQLLLPDPVIGLDAASVLPGGEQLLQFSNRDDLPDSESPAESEAAQRTDGGEAQLRPHPSGVELCLDDGSQFIVSTEPVPAELSVEGQLLVFRDVTAQREQELEFQAVIEHTSDIVTIVDPDGRISYVSPSVEPELAYTQLELVGRDLSELFHPDDIEPIEAEMEAVADSDRTINSQYRVQTDDGDWRMVETTVRGSHSTPATDGVIITIRDITDRYQNQQRRRVMNRVLRHDLRNDMNVVVGHAEILTETLDAKRGRHAETIEQKASNLVRLGEKVRKIDQRLHGRDQELKRIDLSRIVEDEVQSIHETYPDTEIRTRVENASILGDTLIRSAVTNLIENAVEHNDSETPEVDVVVTHCPETDRVELTVSDNGPGVPEAEQRVITAGIETPLEHISGLGLWLVKWIVEGMDGELAIENTDPRGSVVTLSFPSLADANAAAADRSATASASRTRPMGGDSVGAPIQTTTRSDE